jgi:transposase
LLVRQRTSQKNNIHGQLHRLGILLDGRASDLFSPKGRAVLAALELDEHERSLLEHKLTVVDVLTALIDELQDEMCQELAQDRRAAILTSIPGIGQLLAYTMLAEMGQMARFPHRRALASYVGVLPLENESGDKDFGRRTGGACNRWLRWAAIEAATGAVRGSASMRSLHSRVKARNKATPGKARVAVARKLMELVHVLLTRGQRYVEPPSRDAASTASQPGRRRRRGNGRGRTHVAGPGSCSGDASDRDEHPSRASQTALSAASAAGR